MAVILCYEGYNRIMYLCINIRLGKIIQNIPKEDRKCPNEKTKWR